MSVTLHTDLGDIKVELYCDLVTQACENFLALCASGYYNGVKFHRNIRGFMAQTGDPSGKGKGGRSIYRKANGGEGDQDSDYYFPDTFVDSLRHSKRGIVSMANRGPDTNGSQFFITYGKQPSLDMKYMVFGKVIDGFEVLDALEKVPVDGKNRPLNAVYLNRVTIHANPIADAAPA
eukprot:Nk52_evm98s151 gene=Nk52_evmTU98s151